MPEKESSNEYQNLSSEDVSRELEHLVSDDSSQNKKEDGIRTFAEDIQEEMKSKNTSLASIALAEQNRSNQYKTATVYEKKVNVLYVVFTLLFIFGGFVAIGFAVREKNNDPIPPSEEPAQVQANSLFSYENERLFSVDGLSRAELIARFLETTGFIKAKGITNIIMTTQSGGSGRTVFGKEFVELIGLNFDRDALPYFENDFMIGFSVGQTPDTFLVLQHSNQEKIRTAFRVWEPFLIDDIGRLFQIETPSNFLATRAFQSELIENKEARVVRDDSGGFVVGYVFFDTKTIIIATSIETFETIMSRLSIQY